jgi:hypothetical protein
MSDDFLDGISAELESISSSSDLLTRIKELAKKVRGLEATRTQLEEELAAVKRQIQEATERDLVKLMSEANMTSFALESDGNYPAVTFDKTTFYSAKIPEDKEIEAFAWLHDKGHGDIVKTQITVALGMGERDLAEQVEHAISDAGADYSSKLSVHPATLKSFVKSEVESGRALPLELFGAFIGEVVKLKKGK